MEWNIAIAQMDIAFADPEKNKARVKEWIEQAASKAADIIVLPELFTTGYALDQMDELADEEGVDTITYFSKLARDYRINIVAGSVAKKTDDGIFNTMYVFNRHGAIAKEYSKAHLFRLMNEEKYLSEGQEGGLFKLESGPAAGLICYDIRFPEWVRTQMIHPKMTPNTLYVVAEWPAPRIEQWRSLLIARAIENQCFVVACNRVGSDPNNEFGGKSLVIDPLGNVIQEGDHTEQLLFATIETDDVHEVRENIPVFQDRRKDLYRL
ncbi:carbon-nitrogen family hydrolase [Paenalkalicoccus suaedae]|uniref:Carbon-nitrogen family hydrolase n=1 Tax=Paenalkalicoccus suaedae TaxID=2592382 RepID=A0A859FGC9_9BACI|nr:carbon-nitrogen family hydrolase [Paenalkalicoccus suaedae]QKS72423.1 carbon-nitrogen family hydrolase [Paenalkalicoccus suaedae]